MWTVSFSIISCYSNRYRHFAFQIALDKLTLHQALKLGRMDGLSSWKSSQRFSKYAIKFQSSYSNKNSRVLSVCRRLWTFFQLVNVIVQQKHFMFTQPGFSSKVFVFFKVHRFFPLPLQLIAFKRSTKFKILFLLICSSICIKNAFSYEVEVKKLRSNMETFNLLTQYCLW